MLRCREDFAKVLPIPAPTNAKNIQEMSQARNFCSKTVLDRAMSLIVVALNVLEKEGGQPNFPQQHQMLERSRNELNKLKQTVKE
mmetsp:Transcript_40489/g.127503  ORF Transcript_40489/g.127503 Transcript_40489/m.127503 type:complete len:85 (-) Transcript_40489:41-295(-)